MANGKENRKENRLNEALTTIGIFTAWFGGVTGVFAAVGYVIILAFANTTKIYGRINFTQQLPFESLFAAVFAGLKFCGENWVHFSAFLATSVLVACTFLKDIQREEGAQRETTLKKDSPLKIITIAGTIVALLMIVAIGQYSLRPNDQWFIDTIDDYLLYCVSFPLLIGLLVILVTRFKAAFPKKNEQTVQTDTKGSNPTWYCSTAGVFISILFLAPFLYGTAFYDLPAYNVRKVIYNDSLLNALQPIDTSNDVSFFVGQTSDRCLFLFYDTLYNSFLTTTMSGDQIKSIDLVHSKKPQKSYLFHIGQQRRSRLLHRNDERYTVRHVLLRGFQKRTTVIATVEHQNERMNSLNSSSVAIPNFLDKLKNMNTLPATEKDPTKEGSN